MSLVQITADVYALEENICYRLYVDEFLMTERTFAWSPWSHYISEHIVIESPPGTEHTVRVESIKMLDKAVIKRVTVNGQPANQTFIVPE